MGHYAKLGTLAMRCAAVALFATAVFFLFFGLSGMSMRSGPGAMMGARGSMMGGGGALAGAGLFVAWWPALFSAALGALLFTLSRALGSVLASGLDD